MASRCQSLLLRLAAKVGGCVREERAREGGMEGEGGGRESWRAWVYVGMCSVSGTLLERIQVATHLQSAHTQGRGRAHGVRQLARCLCSG